MVLTLEEAFGCLLVMNALSVSLNSRDDAHVAQDVEAQHSVVCVALA